MPGYGSPLLHWKISILYNHGRLHLVGPSGYSVAHDYLIMVIVDFLGCPAKKSFPPQPQKVSSATIQPHLTLKYMTAATLQQGKGEGQKLEPQQNTPVLSPCHFPEGTLTLTPSLSARSRWEGSCASHHHILSKKQTLYPACSKPILTHSGETLFYLGLGARFFHKSSTPKAGFFVTLIY